MVRTKRVYLPPEPDDGVRVLVDRLWPRGLTKRAADVDVWLKQVAPSPQLRTWWNHDPARMDEFAQRYRQELEDNPAVPELQELIRTQPPVTLVYAARDPRINHAQVLAEYLDS